MSAISGDREELNQKCKELSTHLQEIRFSELSLRKDCDALSSEVTSLERRKQDHAGRTETLLGEIKAAEASTTMLRVQIDNLKNQAEMLRRSAQEERNSIESINGSRMELERISVDLRSAEREKSGERERIGHELARLEERKDNLQKEYDGIISRLWEEYELIPQ